MMSSWQKVKLADCVELLAAFPFQSHRFTDNPGDVPLVKGENVSQACILWDISKRCLLGEIPEGWDVRPFTEIANVLSGGTPKTDVAHYWDGEIPFFTPRDAADCFYVQDTEKHVTDAGLAKCASFLDSPETVFITARGTVGKAALPAVDMAMNQSSAKSKTSAAPATCFSPACSPARSMWRRCRSQS